nr:methylenetetrahydrofolate reductase [Granulosicoccus sp.]
RTADDVGEDIQRFRNMGIRHIVALRGDATESGTSASDSSEPVCQYASDLVKLLKRHDDMSISVAAYPEIHPDAAHAEADLEALQHKLELGSDRAITQFFYEPDVFLAFRDRAEAAGISQPIVPGILPIHNIEKVINFSERCGTHVPAGLIDEFRVWHHDEEATRELALAHGLAMCETLKQNGVDHFHFYTLNQSTLAYEIAKAMVGERVGSAVAA